MMTKMKSLILERINDILYSIKLKIEKGEKLNIDNIAYDIYNTFKPYLDENKIENIDVETVKKKILNKFNENKDV